MLIQNDTQLRQFIPNVMNNVEGEASLYEKLSPFIGNAENWLAVMFTGWPLLRQLAALSDSVENGNDDNDDSGDRGSSLSALKVASQHLVANEAFRAAVPSLDLVLTPNGFGIVSNNNVAPASKERIERLISSLVDKRDEIISSMLPLLFSVSGWSDTACGRFFASTLFPALDVVDMLSPSVRKQFPSSKWETYLEIVPRIQRIEMQLAVEWVSPEVMESLRSATTSDSSGGALLHSVITQLRSFIVSVLNNEPFNHKHIEMIVDVIRKHPDTFPEWQGTKTAELFEPALFENEKKSSGYFF